MDIIFFILPNSAYVYNLVDKILIRNIQEGNKMEDKRIIIILVAIVIVLAAVLGGMFLQT